MPPKKRARGAPLPLPLPLPLPDPKSIPKPNPQPSPTSPPPLPQSAVQSLSGGPTAAGASNSKKKVVKKVIRKVKRSPLTGGTGTAAVSIDAGNNSKTDLEKMNPAVVETTIVTDSEPSVQTCTVEETPVVRVPMEVQTGTSGSLASGPELNAERSGEGTESAATKGNVKKVIRKVIKKKIVKKMVPKGTLAAKKAAEAALGLQEGHKAGEEIEKIVVRDVNPSDNAGHSREIPTSEPGIQIDAEVNKEMSNKIGGDKNNSIEIGTDSVNRKEIDCGFKAGGEVQEQKADCSTSSGGKKVRKVIKKKIIKKIVPKGTLSAKRTAEENPNVSANSDRNPEQAQTKGLMVSANQSLKKADPKHSSNAEIRKGIEIEGSREKQKTALPVKQHAKETKTQVEKSEAIYPGSNKEEEKPQQGSTTTMADRISQMNSSSNTGSEEMDGLTERQKRRKTEIFIGGLDKEVTEKDIRSIFEKAGEVVEVRMFVENNTGKNKGYCFLRYKEPAQAKKAISMFSKVEIRGKRCGAAPVEDNDSIFLGNIDKRWKKDDIIRMLKDFGIEKIDSVTVMQDPQNPELNRGFAFLDLETNRDAQIVYKKLKAGDFSKGGHVRIDWAEPWHEPDEEEMLKVKSVFVEFVPSSWDKAKMSEIFEKFGQIERVVLARDIPSSKRKDYAFVNYTTREAAIACIKLIEKEELVENGSKVNIKVSLAKPVSKGKMTKGGGRPSASEKEKHKMLQSHKSSTADGLRVLREPAPRQEIGNPKGKGLETHKHGMHVEKRGLSAVSGGPVYSDMRGFPQPRYESSYHGFQGSSNSSFSGTQPYGIQGPSLFYQNPSVASASGSYHVKQSYYPDASETRETMAPPHGHRGWPYPPRCKNSDVLFS